MQFPLLQRLIPQAKRAQSPSSRRREKCPTAPLREGISWASHRTLISEPLLVCARTTIGMGVKQLLVSGVNHYWVAPETTTGMRANNYCFTSTRPIASPSRATNIGSHHPLTEEGQKGLYDIAVYPQQETQRDHTKRARQTALRHPPKWAETPSFSIIF